AVLVDQEDHPGVRLAGQPVTNLGDPMVLGLMHHHLRIHRPLTPSPAGAHRRSPPTRQAHRTLARAALALRLERDATTSRATDVRQVGDRSNPSLPRTLTRPTPAPLP